jgi:predicted transcriptional regulator
MEQLNKQEETVMRQVWRLGRATVREVLEALPDPKPPYTTLASTMLVLKQKGFVNQSRQGITYYYSAAVAESDYKRNAVGSLVHDYFSNSFKNLVSFFAKEEKISAEDLADILKDIERGRPSK